MPSIDAPVRRSNAQVVAAERPLRAASESGRPTAASAVAAGVIAAVRLDRRWWLAIGALGVGGALLAVGVPVSTLFSFALLGGCLGMHLFMGHGMSHSGHAASDGHAGHGGNASEVPGTELGPDRAAQPDADPSQFHQHD